MISVYLVGSPGAGKTTLLSTLLGNYAQLDLLDRPFKHTTYSVRDRHTALLGWTRAPFGGTDTLPYTVKPTVEAWLPTAAQVFDVLIGEGDRLANDGFFDALAAVSERLEVVHLRSSEEVEAERRAGRAAAYGMKPQNATWVKGRATKAARLAEKYGTLTLDGRLPLRLQAELLEKQVYG